MNVGAYNAVDQTNFDAKVTRSINRLATFRSGGDFWDQFLVIGVV